jgi:cobalamin-dependent methionine synthase I
MDASKTIELLSTLMLENMTLRNKIEETRKENDELKAKYITKKSKKVKEVDPSKPKKKYGKLDDETLATKRRENGLRLAAWRKSKKESESSVSGSDPEIETNNEELE